MKKAVNDFFKVWGKKSWFVINMFFTIVYLMWRLFFTIPFGYGFISVFAGVALLLVEILGMVEAFIHYINMYNSESYPLPVVSESNYPDVDVFVSTYSEPTELLEITLRGCIRMDYPDKSKVHIYLCDDGHREEMRILANKLGVNYLNRDTHTGAKAGNLNHALANSFSPYIVTFDADMIPQSRFLMQTIPYFVDSEIKNKGLSEEDQINLGFVQTPQSFYDLDLFQFHLFSENRVPNEQDYFYKDIQVARTRTNSVIYGGSNTVISRKALEDIGGFYTKAITEDFATGILIEKKGYVSLGTGEVLASGMNANSLKGLIQQRVRWARGVIATGRKMHIFTSKDLSFAQKMNYWASIWYWYAPLKRLIYIMSPILYATFGYMVFRCTLFEVLLFWLPMYISSNISLRALSQNIRSTKWTAIYETALFPFMLLPILLESVGITLKKFKVTTKEKQQNEKGKNIIYMVPFLILIALSVIGIINCIFIMFDSGSIGPIVVLFWLINNLFMLVMSLFFVDGRVPYRETERVSVELPCKIKVKEVEYSCLTKDISESGIALTIEKPHYISPTDDIRAIFDTGKYHAEISVLPMYVAGLKDSTGSSIWKYSFKIKDFHNSYDNWLAILYDRIPTLPIEIKKNSGFYDDLSINIHKRAESTFFDKRHLPRITIDALIPCRTINNSIKEVFVHDFNYIDVSIENTKGNDKLFLILKDCEDIELVYNKDISGRRLYKICNPELLYNTQEAADKIMNAILSYASSESIETDTKKNKSTDFNDFDILTPQKL